MITSDRLEEIEAAATTQPGAETSTLLEYTDGAVPDLVLELVDEIRQQRWVTSAPRTALDAQPVRRIDESLEDW